MAAIQKPIRQQALLLWVAVIVTLLDQVSKHLIETILPLYHSWTPIPLAPQIRLSHLSNTGSAFGLFPANSDLFAWAAVIVSLGILYYNFSLPAGQKIVRLALGLQLGGALGNLIDRLRLGHVTDFIDFGPWVFNLADAAIVLGAFILAWLIWQESRRRIPVPEEGPKFSNEATIRDE